MTILLDIPIITREQQGWIALVVAMLAISYLMFRPRFKKKKDPLEKLPFSGLAQQRSVERQMQNLLVELSEMTRKMNGQIETRVAKLEELIKQADERIEALRQAGGAPPSLPSSPIDLPAPISLAPPSPSPVLPVEEESIVDLDPRHAEIYSLADEGRDAREIATRLGRPSGEVELILALRPRV